MSLSPSDLDVIAERVAARLPDGSGARAWLRTAGEAIGLIAGAVAFVYLLGGLVIALRMIFDRFTLEETVGLIGQLPREFVVTAGFVEVVGISALVGLVAGLVLAAFNRPKRVQSKDKRWPKLTDQRLLRMPTWFWLIGLAVVLVAPSAAWLALASDLKPLPSVVAIVAAALPSYGVVCLGWYGLRRVGMTAKADGEKERTDADGEKQSTDADGETQRSGEVKGSRGQRALLGGAIWAGMTVPGVVVFLSLVGFEPARVCIRGSGQELTGRLVANTGEQVLLLRREDDPETRSVVTVPGDRVERLDYGGNLGDLPSCSEIQAG
jgi:hypothetical protein